MIGVIGMSLRISECGGRCVQVWLADTLLTIHGTDDDLRRLANEILGSLPDADASGCRGAQGTEINFPERP